MMLVMKQIDVSALPPAHRDEAVNEVRTMAKVASHPYFVKYREAFLRDKTLCIVMDYCAGGELQSKIRKFQESRSAFSEAALRQWLVQLALALQFLHKNKLLHRDLKSANIFLDSNNQIRLGDFGLSKHLANTLAKAKTFCGTPVYMAPEHEYYGSAADIWALGVVMYEIATLRIPFQAPNLAILFNKVCNEPTPLIPSRYSQNVRQLCASMLHKDSTKRPTATQILQSPILQREVKRMKQVAGTSEIICNEGVIIWLYFLHINVSYVTQL
ncbi:NEK kinase [Cardiosporidium cionae]|uniref:non-specific serine/threonine protein kinase n=1 Tax=Cardiosporidium cionae TaxID=476202 RepID=A0ABQ7JEH0_9APIC|nr:NEK kinase [Cardiosporidium cionae]|eukprot:KAF8822284.1 NEK kinase [Cardiosporidium cionae]